MSFDLSDYKRFVSNSLENSQYITNSRATKLFKEIDIIIDEKVETKKTQYKI